MNSKEFLKFQVEQHQFAAQQIELYSHDLKKGSRAGDLKWSHKLQGGIFRLQFWCHRGPLVHV